MNPRLTSTAAALIVSIPVLLMACGGSEKKSSVLSTAGSDIKVTETEFAEVVDHSDAKAGTIKFTVTNRGEVEHEFVVFKTELAPDALPADPDDANKAAEEADGIEPIDELEGIEPGSTKELVLDLSPGKYVFICNLPSHYKQGMRVGFTVN